MEIVASIAAKIAEYAIKPVGEWLCYSCQYGSNMENLKYQLENLREDKATLEHSIDAHARNGEVIEDHVNTWLTKVGEITELATRIMREGEEEVEARSANASCPNLKQRHQLSQEAKNIAGNIVDLRKKLDLNKVSYRPALEATVRYMDYVTLESRMSVVKGIMKALGDANTNKIGVWGMAGVGKTTLMSEMARKVKEDELFHEVAISTVSDNPDVRRIQGEIADTLGLEFEQETDKGRAIQLQSRLSTDKEKKILIILDDLWKQLDLVEIGITPSERCKIVLTSRNQEVLSTMGTQKDFSLQTLTKEEAWKLFEERAGESFEDPNVRGIATEVAEECAGLPIALATVSKALKNKPLPEWRDALRRLKTPAPPQYMPEMLKTIYSPIELSYNMLGTQELKSLFLLCAQLTHFIHYRDFLIYSYGYGLFHGINTLQEARDSLDTLLHSLKDSSLLLESSNGFHLHDLVRDVATIIASEDNNMLLMRDEGGPKVWPDADSLKRCKAFSILGGNIDQLPNKMECPELIFFYIYHTNQSLKIPDTLFQGMDKLKVLDLEKMPFSSLPSSLLLSKNLQTLCLDGCELEDISGIGELKNLVILSLRGSRISELPKEVGSLIRLRMLDLSNCDTLETFPLNVLSSLVKLQELYLGSRFAEWEADQGLNDEREYANLAELKHMSRLMTLETEIPDANNLPTASMFEKLERYTIFMGGWMKRGWGPGWGWGWAKGWPPGSDWAWNDSAQLSRTLKLELNSSFQLAVWIKMLLKRTEDLQLAELNGVKSVIPEMDGEGFQQLKHLEIQNNSEIKHIVNLRTSIIAFPILEKFVVRSMFNLEEICCGKLSPGSFRNLRVLKVRECEKLRFFFSSSIARELSLLEELEVIRCDSMVAIVVKEEEEEEVRIKDGDMSLFCKLKKLVLEALPKLVSFLSTKNSLMIECGEMITEGNHDVHMTLLHHQIVAFPSLEILHICGLPKIQHVWTECSETNFTFQNLKELWIHDCGVEEIVAVEGGGGGGGGAVARFVFPRVTDLLLFNLRRLKWFYKGVHVSKWPMLKCMVICGCDQIEKLVSGIHVSFEETVRENIKQPLFLVDELSFPSLEMLEIERMEKLEIIWQDQVATSSFSNIQNLQVMGVIGCESLRSVFPSSVISCLKQLKKLRIENCGVEEIVSSVEGEGKEAIARFVFPQLTNLRLRELHRLKWFYKGVHVSKWPKLEKMRIEKCHEVEILFASAVVRFQEAVEERRSEMSIKQPLFLVDNDELSFPSLKNVEIVRMEKLEIIWQDQVATSSFFNIQKLKISTCKKLETIFGKLERPNGNETPLALIAPESRTKESVVIEDGGTSHLVSTVARPNFEKWESKDPNTIFRFQNLQEIEVYGCYSLRCIFPTSAITCLKQLKRLEIKDCGMEEIVSVEGEGGEAEARFVFPQVTKLSLERLDRLKWFYNGVHVSNWPMLEEMRITKCDKVEIIASGVVRFQEMVSIKQPLFLVDLDRLSFPSLKILYIQDMNKLEIICQDQVAEMSFSNLRILGIFGCQHLRLPIFQSNIPTTTLIQNLTELHIECGCDDSSDDSTEFI